MYKFAAVLMLFVFLLAGCRQDDAPKTAFAEFNRNLTDKNWVQVWDGISSKSRKAFEEDGFRRTKDIIETMPPETRKEKIETLGITHNELLDMSARDFFVLVMEKTESSQDFSALASAEVASVKITDGGRAVLKLKNSNEAAHMVLEDGRWKVEFEEY